MAYFEQGMQAYLELFHSIPQPILPDSSEQNWRVPSPFPCHGTKFPVCAMHSDWE